MHRRLDVRRFRIGLYGLALLRGWPLDDGARADEQMEEIDSLLR